MATHTGFPVKRVFPGQVVPGRGGVETGEGGIRRTDEENTRGAGRRIAKKTMDGGGDVPRKTDGDARHGASPTSVEDYRTVTVHTPDFR